MSSGLASNGGYEEERAALVRTEHSDRRTLRIGLISDTHIPEARAELWPQVFAAFEDAGYIAL
jgi:hypothetical protein